MLLDYRRFLETFPDSQTYENIVIFFPIRHIYIIYFLNSLYEINIVQEIEDKQQLFIDDSFVSVLTAQLTVVGKV